ncbi:MAG: type II toxin-antitoxin system Phd/YefM family antitoxin [Oscillospiraceae bacterium]|jgi:prevent-host-death family protein|nr:type II toxin-antitoxin system Phd/YefM family antitoxin [Oscillospiraceae bacterium]
MPHIKSSTDLRNNYNEISTFCHETHEPVFITKNGRGDLAVMSIDAYNKLSGRQELYDLLAEGRADVLAGRGKPAEEAFADMRRRIANGEL